MSNETEAPEGVEEVEGESKNVEPQEESGAQDVVAADLAKFKDLALRTQADFENYRKRAQREKEDAVRFANATFLEKLIPILDNFELGLEAARGDASASSILTGMDMVSRQLTGFLGEIGVQPVDAVGEKFDPNSHEAIAQEASQDVEEGVVIRQMRRGYKLKDRLLRPATVVVSKGAAGASL